MLTIVQVIIVIFNMLGEPSQLWTYGSWIYNYLCNQCLSPLMLWVRISIRVRCTTLCYKVCQWLATGRWFSPGPPFSSTNKTDCHNITEISLNTIKQTNVDTCMFYKYIHIYIHVYWNVIWRNVLFCLYHVWCLTSP